MWCVNEHVDMGVFLCEKFSHLPWSKTISEVTIHKQCYNTVLGKFFFFLNVSVLWAPKWRSKPFDVFKRPRTVKSAKNPRSLYLQKWTSMVPIPRFDHSSSLEGRILLRGEILVFYLSWILRNLRKRWIITGNGSFSTWFWDSPFQFFTIMVWPPISWSRLFILLIRLQMAMRLNLLEWFIGDFEKIAIYSKLVK